jgi:hypothetical protein
LICPPSTSNENSFDQKSFLNAEGWLQDDNPKLKRFASQNPMGTFSRFRRRTFKEMFKEDTGYFILYNYSYFL